MHYGFTHYGELVSSLRESPSCHCYLNNCSFLVIISSIINFPNGFYHCLRDEIAGERNLCVLDNPLNSYQFSGGGDLSDLISVEM